MTSPSMGELICIEIPVKKTRGRDDQCWESASDAQSRRCGGCRRCKWGFHESHLSASGRVQDPNATAVRSEGWEIQGTCSPCNHLAKGGGSGCTVERSLACTSTLGHLRLCQLCCL